MTIIEQAFAPLWRINLIPANLVAISNHVYGIKIVLCNNKGLYQKNSIRLIYLSISHWWYVQKKCHTWLSDRGKFLSHTRRCKIYIFRVGHPCGFVSVLRHVTLFVSHPVTFYYDVMMKKTNDVNVFRPNALRCHLLPWFGLYGGFSFPNFLCLWIIYVQTIKMFSSLYIRYTLIFCAI